MNLNICCWWWANRGKHRSYRKFDKKCITKWADMIERSVTIPHNLYCITEFPNKIDDSRIIPIKLRYDHLLDWGDCYVRLQMFSSDYIQLIGGRMVSMDLDCIIKGNIDHLFNTEDDFVIWSPRNAYKTPCCGSMWMLNAGTKPEIWDKFSTDDLEWSKNKRRYINKKAFNAGYKVGSDQAWIAYMLWPDKLTVWTDENGIINYKAMQEGDKNNFSIIFFPGKYNPWDLELQKHKWIKKYYG